MISKRTKLLMWCTAVPTMFLLAITGLYVLDRTRFLFARRYLIRNFRADLLPLLVLLLAWVSLAGALLDSVLKDRRP